MFEMHFKISAVLFQSGHSLWCRFTPNASKTRCGTMPLRTQERHKMCSVLLLLGSPARVSVIIKFTHCVSCIVFY